MDELPIFGARGVDADYVIRPSAYALIMNAQGAIAVVRAPAGIFLPGGGIEAGEAPEDAVIREAMEECGLTVRAGERVAAAIQLAHSELEATSFEKVSTFIIAEIVGRASSPVEYDHELLWLPVDDAASLLTHESHRWAVLQWKARAKHEAG